MASTVLIDQYIGVGCQATDLDVSPSAFAQLADPGLGRVTTNWAWL